MVECKDSARDHVGGEGVSSAARFPLRHEEQKHFGEKQIRSEIGDDQVVLESNRAGGSVGGGSGGIVES